MHIDPVRRPKEIRSRADEVAGNSASEQPVFGLREGADYLGITRRRLLDLVRRGELRAHYSRRRWRFSRAVLDAFLVPVPAWTIDISRED